MLVRLRYELAHVRLLEHLLCVGGPEVGNGGVGPTHAGFKVLVRKTLGQVGGEVDLELTVRELHSTEAHLQSNVFIKADQVLNGREDGLKSIVHDILTHLAGRGHGHRVGIDGTESLLVDGFLTAGRRDLLLAVVTV